MGKNAVVLLPNLQNILTEMGENIRLARLRRGFSVELVAERAGISRATLWAVEKGITTGTSAKRFSPSVTCSNAHILTFIWRALGEPDKTGTGEWYSDSVAWAENGGLLGGTYTGEFDVNADCPRANVVTYLYRYLNTGALTIYVSPSGNDETADGSPINPYRTIEAAKEAVRALDKNRYTSIKVRIGAGEYRLSEPLGFIAEDSGTVSCQISYVGEKGTMISGGVSFTSADFTKAEGDVMAFFPENVRDSLVMIDLKQFGFKAEDVKQMILCDGKEGQAPLSLNGNRMTVARYPNEDFAYVRAGSQINCEGGEKNAVDMVTTTTIFFDEEHTEHLKTWHDLSDVYTQARYSVLWCADDTNVLSFDEEENSMTVPFAGGHDPREGMPFYWYNIPEELDAPGEYYIDKNCVLYFCPTKDFDGAHFTMPVLDDCLVVLNGADYLTFSNLTLEATRKSGISGDGDHITVIDCTVRSCSGNGIDLTGNSLMIRDNEVYSIGKTGIRIDGGDAKTLRQSDDIVYNNYIHEWATGGGTMRYAIAVAGCGVTVSHNDCVNSVDMAIDYNGPYHIIEYNYCADTCKFFGDGGVIGSGAEWVYGTVVRYNYIKNGGFTRDRELDPMGVQGITVDMGQSGLTAYGNVIENVTGSGFGICGGRDHNIYGNLMIQCYQGLFYDSRFYTQIVRDGHGNRISPDNGYTSNKYWTKAFPILGKLTFADENNFDTVIKDKNFNAATVSVIKDNVYYLDKAVHNTDKQNDPYNIENYVYDFAEIDIPSTDNDTLYRYSSKRTELNVEECIAANENVLAITPELFAQIGRSKK